MYLNRVEKILLFLDNKSSRYHFLRVLIENAKYILKNKFLIEFLKNMSMIFIFKVLTQVIFTVMSIVAARELGPSDMGNIAIINNISNFLMIPMVMGINISMNKYLPVLDEKEQKEMISSTIISNIPLAIILVTVYTLFSNKICSTFHITNSFMISSLILCVLISYNSISESFLRGQKKFKQICYLKLAFTLTFAIILCVQFYFMGSRDISSYLSTNYIAYAVFIIGALLLTGVRHLKFNRKMVASVYSYGFINMLGAALNIFLTSCDLFFVKSFCSSVDTGLYSVYMGNAKSLLGLLFFEIFGVVFLPAIASMDKQKVYKNIIKYSVPTFIAVFCAGVLWSTLSIFLYGNKYEYNILFVLLVSASLAVTFIYQLFCFTIAMEGTAEARFTLITGALPLPMAIFLQFILTKYWGITGTFVAVLIVNIILLFTLLLSVRWYRAKKKQNTKEGRISC